jgi:hypothetical protein
MSRIVPSGPRGSRGAFLRAGAVALLILAHGSCYEDSPEICYEDVEVCGVAVTGMYGRLVDGGCDEDYWSYSVGTPGIGCDSEGFCSGSTAAFDLRSAGYDAMGFVEIEVDMGSGSARVSGTRVCTGADCGEVSEAFGVDLGCGDQVSAARTCFGDTGWDGDSGWDDDWQEDPEIFYTWSDEGLEIEVYGAYTTGFDLGLAETIDMTNGWFGEDCRDGAMGYDECHVFTGTVGRLDSVYDELLAGTATLEDVQSGSTTAFGKSHYDGNRITYALTVDDGTCWAWGHDPTYYDDWRCEPLP